MSSPFQDDVASARQANAELVASLAGTFRAQGRDPSDLDEHVLDLAGTYGADGANLTDDEDEQEMSISRFESEASEINNGDLEDQIAALIVAYGADMAKRLVESNDPDFDPSRPVPTSNQPT